MKRWMAAGVLALGLSAVGPAHADVTLFGGPSLYNAVVSGDVKTVRQLLLRGENPNGVGSGGKTPLIVAVQSERSDIAQALLENRAAANGADPVGNTALYWAASQGNADLVDLLLSHGARIDQENRQGMTPLMAAARSGAVDTVEKLLKHGARTDAADFTGRTALSWAEEGRNGRVAAALRKAGAN